VLLLARGARPATHLPALPPPPPPLPAARRPPPAARRPHVKVWQLADGAAVFQVGVKSLNKDAWPLLHWSHGDAALLHAVTNTVHQYAAADGFKGARLRGVCVCVCVCVCGGGVGVGCLWRACSAAASFWALGECAHAW
jgi:hypothetical protein